MTNQNQYPIAVNIAFCKTYSSYITLYYNICLGGWQDMMIVLEKCVSCPWSLTVREFDCHPIRLSTHPFCRCLSTDSMFTQLRMLRRESFSLRQRKKEHDDCVRLKHDHHTAGQVHSFLTPNNYSCVSAVALERQIKIIPTPPLISLLVCYMEAPR